MYNDIQIAGEGPALEGKGMKIATILTAFLAVTSLSPAWSAGAVQIAEESAENGSQVRSSDIVIVPDKDYGAAPFVIAGGTTVVLAAAGIGVYRSRKGGRFRRNSKNNKINRNP